MIKRLHMFFGGIFSILVSPTIAKYEWELEILQNHKLILYYENMPHGAFYIAEEYTIKYCNQNYIGLENAGQVKNLYRQNKKYVLQFIDNLFCKIISFNY